MKSIIYKVTLFALFALLAHKGMAQCATDLNLGQNMVTNGDFSAGQTGFSFTPATNCSATLTTGCPTGDGYRDGFLPCGSSCYSTPGVIWVGDRSGYFNQAFALGTTGFTPSIQDHTPTADNLFLMVDGTCTDGIDAWSQTLTVKPGVSYYFECWVTNLNNAGGTLPLAVLNFDVNNQTLTILSSGLNTFTTPTAQGTWSLVSAVWTAPAGVTVANIRIENSTTTGCSNGVDFGLDDITFTPGCIFAAPGPQPNLGPDRTLCGTGGSLIIDAGIPVVQRTSNTIISWSDGTTYTGTAASNYVKTITTPGTYSVCVKENVGGCTKSDVIVISNTYSIDLGGPYNLCNPASQLLDAQHSGTGVTYKWYKKIGAGAFTENDTIPGEHAKTYNATAAARYRVCVTDPSCLPTQCDEALVETDATATPVDAYFCSPPAKNVDLAVTGSGIYDWYSVAVGGTPLAGGTATNTFTTPAISNNTTYYVQDSRYYTTTVGATTLGASYSQTNLDQYKTAFTVTQSVIIDSVTVYWFMNNSNPNDQLRIQFQLTDNPMGTTATTNVGAAGPVWTSTNALANAAGLVTPTYPTPPGQVYAVRVPVNITVPAAGSYRLTVTNVTTGNVQIQNGGTYNYNDPNGIISLIGAQQGGNPVGTTYYGGMYRWAVRYRTNCGRIPVKAILNCTLPVELLNFEAVKQGHFVALSWTTITEQNNSHFNIERSVDGINFNSIGTVKGFGNSSSWLNYDYNDNSAPKGVFYYRLAQYDFDGQVTYSPVRVINLEDEELNIMPNPSEGNFEISVKAGKDVVFNTYVINSIGQIVYNKSFNSTGEYFQENLDLSNLSNGIYLLHVVTEGTSWVKKLIKE